MTYLIEATNGDILGYGNTEAEAVEQAKALLADDPELGELTVARSEILATVTFGPTADFDTQIVVLRPGERGVKAREAYDRSEKRMSDEEFDAYVSDVYADEWAKAEGMRNMREKGLI